jgi:hypothetical protein
MVMAYRYNAWDGGPLDDGEDDSDREADIWEADWQSLVDQENDLPASLVQ